MDTLQYKISYAPIGQTQRIKFAHSSDHLLTRAEVVVIAARHKVQDAASIRSIEDSKDPAQLVAAYVAAMHKAGIENVEFIVGESAHIQCVPSRP